MELATSDQRYLLTPNLRLLLNIPGHTEVVISQLSAIHMTQEIFIVGDDDQLKVLLVSSHFDEFIERPCKRNDVVAIQVCGRLVQSNHPTINAETLCQC